MMHTKLRLRSKLSEEQMALRVKKVLTDEDHDVLLRGPASVHMPDGRPLCVYLPGAVKEAMDAAYPILHTIRGTTENRGYASGTNVKHVQNNVQRAKPVMSSILGSFESSGFYKFCRLTSWTAHEMEDRWPQLLPLWQGIAALLRMHVPDRYQNQARAAAATAPDWIIPGTPFTTITVNNTFPTGVHKDQGDLDEGFSCIAVARRGDFTGGVLTFPEYRVAVDMQDGDLILMDAHAWHGNTAIRCTCASTDRENRPANPPAERKVLSQGPCEDCGAERISVVCYYRTKMATCGTGEEETEKALAWQQRWNATRAGAGADFQG